MNLKNQPKGSQKKTSPIISITVSLSEDTKTGLQETGHTKLSWHVEESDAHRQFLALCPFRTTHDGHSPKGIGGIVERLKEIKTKLEKATKPKKNRSKLQIEQECDRLAGEASRLERRLITTLLSLGSQQKTKLD